MSFCGSGGVTAFFPEDIQDNPYVPPIVLTSFTIFNEPVEIGADSGLKRAIPYAESLTLPHVKNVFSFLFAALSYANSHKNRYRFTLEGFRPGWTEVDSKHRLATYTNLDPGHYVFRVQGSNSDGVWNDVGVSLPILVTPPWYLTNLFFGSAGVLFLGLLWGAYQVRMRQVQHAFEATLEARSRRADAHRPRAARYPASKPPRSVAAIPDGLVPDARAPGRGERETGHCD